MSSLNPVLREQYFALINNEIEKDLVHRFTQVLFKGETWASIGNVYWIQQSLDLILGILISYSLNNNFN
jgi:hypothetical protein